VAALEHAEHDKWALDVLDNVLGNLLNSAKVVWGRHGQFVRGYKTKRIPFQISI
jgi:hypothetical protein